MGTCFANFPWFSLIRRGPLGIQSSHTVEWRSKESGKGRLVESEPSFCIQLRRDTSGMKMKIMPAFTGTACFLVSAAARQTCHATWSKDTCTQSLPPDTHTHLSTCWNEYCQLLRCYWTSVSFNRPEQLHFIILAIYFIIQLWKNVFTDFTFWISV